MRDPNIVSLVFVLRWRARYTHLSASGGTGTHTAMGAAFDGCAFLHIGSPCPAPSSYNVLMTRHWHTINAAIGWFGLAVTFTWVVATAWLWIR